MFSVSSFRSMLSRFLPKFYSSISSYRFREYTLTVRASPSKTGRALNSLQMSAISRYAPRFSSASRERTFSVTPSAS